MPGAVWVQACAEPDFDTATGTCAAPYWTLQQQVVPAITIDQANELGTAVALLLAFAFALRKLRSAVVT